MADVEKVIKGLEALYDSMHKNQCYVCSHEFIENAENFGTEIIADALKLLKTQQKQIEEMRTVIMNLVGSALTGERKCCGNE